MFDQVKDHIGKFRKWEGMVEQVLFEKGEANIDFVKSLVDEYQGLKVNQALYYEQLFQYYTGLLPSPTPDLDPSKDIQMEEVKEEVEFQIQTT